MLRTLNAAFTTPAVLAVSRVSLGAQPGFGCRARLATDASQMYPLAIKYITCASQREYRVVKHEASLMQATSRAGLSCVPQLYDVHWLEYKAAAYLVMQ